MLKKILFSFVLCLFLSQSSFAVNIIEMQIKSESSQKCSLLLPSQVAVSITESGLTKDFAYGYLVNKKVSGFLTNEDALFKTYSLNTGTGDIYINGAYYDLIELKAFISKDTSKIKDGGSLHLHHRGANLDCYFISY